MLKSACQAPVHCSEGYPPIASLDVMAITFWSIRPNPGRAANVTMSARAVAARTVFQTGDAL